MSDEQTYTETIRFISWYWRERGFAPSYRTIAKALGYRSTSSVHRILAVLERRGRIVRNPENNSVKVVNGTEPETCEHDWRVSRFANPLPILCADCGRQTEVEFDTSPDCPPKERLKYTGSV